MKGFIFRCVRVVDPNMTLLSLRPISNPTDPLTPVIGRYVSGLSAFETKSQNRSDPDPLGGPEKRYDSRKRARYLCAGPDPWTRIAPGRYLSPLDQHTSPKLGGRVV